MRLGNPTRYWISLLIFCLSHVAVAADLETLLSTKVCAGCQLSGADLTGQDLSEAILAGANLSGARLIGANLTKANLAGANLSKADLSAANLQYANVAAANLAEAKLIGATLIWSMFVGSNMTPAVLMGAQIEQANFTGADLTRTNFSGAKLTKTSFVSAKLIESTLSGANISDSDFASADLKQATVAGLTLDEASKISLAGAKNVPVGVISQEKTSITTADQDSAVVKKVTEPRATSYFWCLSSDGSLNKTVDKTIWESKGARCYSSKSQAQAKQYPKTKQTSSIQRTETKTETATFYTKSKPSPSPEQEGVKTDKGAWCVFRCPGGELPGNIRFVARENCRADMFNSEEEAVSYCGEQIAQERVEKDKREKKEAERKNKEDMDYTFVVLESSAIKSFDDLNAKTLCEDPNDGSMDKFTRKYFEFHGMAVRVRDRLASQKHLAAKDMLEGNEWVARELLLGKCDFVAKKYPSAEYFLKKHPYEFRILPDLMDREVLVQLGLEQPRKKAEKIAKKAPEPERDPPSQTALINLVKLVKNKACVGCELRNISEKDTASGKLDLSGVDLTDADLSGADLDGMKMTGAVFKNTKFINAIFPGNSATKADFSGADVSGATFTRVNFNDANLADVTATGAKFDTQTQMTLQYADNVSESIKLAIRSGLSSLSKEALAERMRKRLPCPGCDLREVDLSKLTKIEGELDDANFEGKNLSHIRTWIGSFKGAKFKNSNLAHSDSADLTRADVTGADFEGANLSNVRLGVVENANLKAAQLDGATLYALNNSEVEGATLKAVKRFFAPPGISENGIADVSLKDMDLSGINLSEVELTNVDLSGANLTGANLKNAQLIGVDLTGTNLSTADLSGAKLQKLNLSGTNFSDAELEQTDLTGVIIDKTTRFEGATLTGVNLSETQLTGFDFSEMNLSQSRFDKSVLDGVKFVDSDLTGVSFAEATLKNISFSEANLGHVDFTRTQMAAVNLSKVNLRGSRFVNTHAAKADLRASNLSAAAIEGSDFSQANLADANMRDVNITGGTLDRANLEGVDLGDKPTYGGDLGRLFVVEQAFGVAIEEGATIKAAIAAARAAYKEDNDQSEQGFVPPVVEGANFSMCESSEFKISKPAVLEILGWMNKNKGGGSDSLIDIYLSAEIDRRLPATAYQDCLERLVKRQLVGLTSASGAMVRWSDVALTNIDLSGRDLSGAELVNVNLTGSNLAKTIFTNVKLDGSIFDGADVSGTSFESATIRGGSFLGSTIDKETRFRKTDLTDVSFLESKAKYAKFDGATLCRTVLPDGTQDDWGCPENVGKIRRTGDPESNRSKLIQSGGCIRCNLAGVDLSGVELECPNLMEADLTGANLSSVVFRRTKSLALMRYHKEDRRNDRPERTIEELEGTWAAEYWKKAEDTKKTCADFTRALLTDSNFNGALLEVPEFTGANMESVNFSDSKLWGAKFYESDLQGAEWSGADLAGSLFSSSILDSTDFRKIHLSDDFIYFRRYHPAHDIQEISVTGLAFNNCSMKGVKFNEVKGFLIEGITDLSNAVFEGPLPILLTETLNLSNVDLSHRKLTKGVGISGMEAPSGIGYESTDIDFSGANLTGVDFSGLTFSKVDLTDACVVGAKPFGFLKRLLGRPESRHRSTTICRTQFSWGEESINCRPED